MYICNGKVFNNEGEAIRYANEIFKSKGIVLGIEKIGIKNSKR